MMDNRGATETLGFVLAFALVTSSIGIVYTAGFGGLQDARNAEQIENVERAFDVLAENFEELRRRGVPSRATELKLLQGEVAIRQPTTFTVNVSGVPNTTFTAHPRPLSYRSQDGETSIVYEAGALFRTDNGNTLMLSPPGWIVDVGDYFVLPITDTSRIGGRASLSGRQTILLVAHFQSREVFTYRATSNVIVNVTIDSPRAAAWKRFLQRKGFNGVDTDPTDGIITYSIKVKRLYVPRTAVGVELTT